MEQNTPQLQPLPDNIPDKHRHIGILSREGVKSGEIAKSMKIDIATVSRVKKKVKNHLLFKPSELKRAAKRTAAIAQGEPVKPVMEKGKPVYDNTGKPLVVEATIDQQLKAQSIMYNVEVPKKVDHTVSGTVAVAVVNLDEFKVDPIDVQPKVEE
jgi:hypothetical protein